VAGAARALIEAINAGKAPVYAVDLPSGINGTSGAVLGAAVKATHTITFFRKKPGHLLLPGRLHCGTISVADIGIPAAVLDKIAPKTFENVPPLWRRHFPVPRHEGHKYDRGHAVVVSGPLWSTGAARLAARGALRAGAGLVTIASPRDALAVNAAASLAVMVRPVDGAAELAKFLSDRRLNALAIGPGVGVGEATCERVLAALMGERAVVLDADAITSFAADPQRLAKALRARSAQATILTPHEGEFSRYVGALDAKIQALSKLERTRAAAKLVGAVVVLKGADTVITVGAIQSNHARQVAAASARLGLHCVLGLLDAVPGRAPAYRVLGNVLLDKLFGAEIRIIPDLEETGDWLNSIAAELTQQGRRPYVIPLGGSNGLGAAAYAEAFLELLSQFEEMQEPLDAIVVPIVSGGTLAGLSLGAAISGWKGRLIGISASDPSARAIQRVNMPRRAAANTGSG